MRLILSLRIVDFVRRAVDQTATGNSVPGKTVWLCVTWPASHVHPRHMGVTSWPLVRGPFADRQAAHNVRPASLIAYKYWTIVMKRFRMPKLKVQKPKVGILWLWGDLSMHFTKVTRIRNKPPRPIMQQHSESAGKAVRTWRDAWLSHSNSTVNIATPVRWGVLLS